MGLALADEPTAHLDSKIGHEIMRLLRSIAKDHIADRVLWLKDRQERS